MTDRRWSARKRAGFFDSGKVYFYDIYKKEAASRRLLKVETVGVEPMTS